MGKKINVAIYIDGDIVKEAKELGLNISRTCENALKEAIKRLKGKYPQNILNSQRSDGSESAAKNLKEGMLRSGFEPESAARKAFKSGTKSSEKRMENIENGRILEDFKDYLAIDRQLSPRAVKRHILELKRLYRFSNFNPLKATKLEIRSYLRNFQDKSPYTYANILKFLRVFYRDYLGKPEVIEGFKFPNRPLRVITIPSKKELQAFYYWLKEPLARAIFLIYSTTGLRREEVLNLKIGDVDFKKKMIIPKGSSSRTKRTYITFYNEEAEMELKRCFGSFQNLDRKAKLFSVSENYFKQRYLAFERETGIKISPQILREWFACEMGRLGVPDRYVDAFCGRVPRTVLARHYTDFSPEKLKEIYDKANLKVLD